MSEPTADPLQAPQLSKFIDRHLALIAAIAIVVFASLRVYFVAGYHLPTALIILAVVDRGQLLTSTVLAALTIAIPVLFLALESDIRAWFRRGNSSSSSFWKRLITGLLFLLTVLLFVVTSSMLIFIGLVVVWLFAFVLSRWVRRARRIGIESRSRHRSRGRPTTNINISRQSTIIFLLTWLAIQVLTAPWLAKEVIRGADAGEDVVGYVIGVQGTMTLVLEHPARSPRWIQTEHIETRSVCRTDQPWWAASLSELGVRSSQGEDCP